MNAIVELPVIRRFAIPDLDRHGKWILPRLLQVYAHLNERAAAGFLQGLVYSNEFLFLYQPQGVALAQAMSAHTLEPKPLVMERFVWVEDPKDPVQVERASHFYTEIYRWAKAQNCATIVVEEMTDVPHDLIKARIGRIFNRQQQFVRV